MAEATGPADVVYGDEMSPFRHTPLPDAEEYIRLVSIDSPPSATTVQCRLSTWPLRTAPQFHAISYTWGRTDRNESIELNGTRMLVRGNCADVLRQLCHLRTALYYWIDALCIDQTNVAEKGQQIGLMGSIYQNAQHVLACLGKVKDEDLLGLRVLQRYSERVSYFHKFSKLDDLQTNNDWHCHFADWLRNSFTRADIFLFWMTCDRLIRTDYFARVWTTPEFLIAQGLFLCIGEHLIHWRALYEAAFFLRNHPWSTLLSVCATEGKGLAWYEALSQDERDRCQRNALEAREQSAGFGRFRSIIIQRQGIFDRKVALQKAGELGFPEQFSLSKRLDIVRSKQCSDPRDYIYAMLPFAQGVYARRTFDYRLPLFDLAVEVLGSDGLEDPQRHALWLINLLQLRRHIEDVQNAMRKRSMWPDAPHSARNHAIYGSGHIMFVRVDNVAGRRLAADEELQLGPPFPDGLVRPVISNSSKEQVGIAGANARPGDWVLRLMSLDDVDDEFHPHDLVVRHSGEGRDCVIVSLAHVQRPWDREEWYPRPRNARQTDLTGFWLRFDVADYVTFLASMVYGADEQLSPSELVNAGVCHAPMSSYAELRPEIAPRRRRAGGSADGAGPAEVDRMA